MPISVTTTGLVCRQALVVHLKRFAHSRLARDKLDNLVEFPLKDLDLSPYVLRRQVRIPPPPPEITWPCFFAAMRLPAYGCIHDASWSDGHPAPHVCVPALQFLKPLCTGLRARILRSQSKTQQGSWLGGDDNLQPFSQQAPPRAMTTSCLSRILSPASSATFLVHNTEHAQGIHCNPAAVFKTALCSAADRSAFPPCARRCRQCTTCTPSATTSAAWAAATIPRMPVCPLMGASGARSTCQALSCELASIARTSSRAEVT